MQENEVIEFKSGFSRSFLKTVSAFANYGEGKILFGVNDDGSIAGVDDPKELCLRIENAINDNVEPLPSYSIDVKQIEGASVIELTVRQGSDTPYCVSGKAYRRSHTATVKVDSAELRRLVLKGMNASFEEGPAQSQALRFTALDAKLTEKLGLDEVDEKVYRTLELMDSEGRFNNAAAVLADENGFPGIDVVRFGPTINEFMDRQTTEHVSALKLYDDAMAMFDRYYKYEAIRGKDRAVEYLVPETAFREAVANALVHRVWDVHAMVRISLFPDRIEVGSPGGLPGDISEEDYLAGRLSVLRNPIIAGVFARLGYIERFGTGVPRIKAAYDGTLFRPRFSITANSITVTLPIVKEDAELSAPEKKVLELLSRYGSLSRAEIEGRLGSNKSNVARLLKSLGAKSLVKTEGRGRATRYKLD